MDKELFTYYNLSECLENDKIIDRLDDLSAELKIDYSYDESNEVIKLVDLDLTEKEIENLIRYFDKNNVIVDLDYRDMYDSDGDLDDYFNQEYDY